MATEPLSNLAANVSAAASSAASMVVDHPYFPVGVPIAGYLINSDSVAKLLGIFFSGCGVIFTATYFVTKTLRPRIGSGELLALMWFVLSGTIHLWFEGYYAYHHAQLASHQTLFGQLWKEYALSDSRYLTNDAFVLCMESVTAFLWGPLCYIVAACIAFDNDYRHPLQIIVSLGQLYGDILYYATSMFDHYMLQRTYSRPEVWYFWGYYVLMNAFWIVIPGYLIVKSVGICAAALKHAKTHQVVKKAQ